MDTLREVEPTSHMGVPRVWEKFMERIQEAAAQSGFIRRKMLLWAMSVALEQNLTCPGRYGRPGGGGRQGGGTGPAGTRGSAGLGLFWGPLCGGPSTHRAGDRPPPLGSGWQDGLPPSGWRSPPGSGVHLLAVSWGISRLHRGPGNGAR